MPERGIGPSSRSAELPLAVVTCSPNGDPGALSVRPPSSILLQNLRCSSCLEFELFRRLAQRKARHMSGLSAIGDPLLAVLAAPRGHQRMERVPVGNPVEFGGEARVIAPLGRTHHREPRRPLTIFAGRDRDIPVACRQDRDRSTVAIRLALARAGFPGEPGSRQLGDRQSRQRLRARDIDDCARRSQYRVHAGAGGGEAADKSGLFADRTDRRFREIVDLSCQQPGNAARKEQRQVGRRIVGLWSGLSEGRDVHQRCGRIEAAETVGVVLQSAKLLRAALTDDSSRRLRSHCVAPQDHWQRGTCHD